MFDRVQYKAIGKANFKAHFWPFIAVTVLYSLVFGQLSSLSVDLSDLGNLAYVTVSSNSNLVTLGQYTVTLLAPFVALGGLFTLAFDLLVSSPYEVGAFRFYLENTTFHTAPFSRVAVGFSENYGNVVLTQFLRNLYIFLWSLLLLIPGIVRAYGYFAVPYILAENPHLDHQRALELSRQMTMGYKGELFFTDLSFLGWHFLNALTLGILGIFYLNPYIQGTKAEIYRFLRVQALANGITSPAELPGMRNL